MLKRYCFKDQPYSEYEYNVTPAPAPWTDDKEYKVWGNRFTKERLLL